MGILEELILSQNNNQQHTSDSKEDAHSVTNGFVSNIRYNNGINSQGQNSKISESESKDQKQNTNPVQTTGIRITSRFPTAVNEDNEEGQVQSATIPILTKIQGQYIETGGGGNFGFFQRNGEGINSQKIDQTTIETIDEDITTQR